jgi:Ca2+-binding EF-hand superfamily protein
MVCIENQTCHFILCFFSSGDIREKLRLAFDMYDMNRNGKVKFPREFEIFLH